MQRQLRRAIAKPESRRANLNAGYLAWDGLQPTTYGHESIANGVYDSLSSAATPEPTSLSLALLGFIALAGFGLRNRFSTSRPSVAKDGS
jgi:hypothetical protein